MNDLIAWLVEILFPYMATAMTSITVLTSILYVIASVKSWLLERKQS